MYEYVRIYLLKTAKYALKVENIAFCIENKDIWTKIMQ